MNGVTPFDFCVCAKCGPPWRDRPRPRRDEPGWLTWGSWMTLCPTCGDKRCAGANDHDRHES